MKTFRLLTFAGLALAATLAGHAQFGLDLSKVTKAVDLAKDGGKVLKGTVTGIGPKEERTLGEGVALEIISRYGGLVRDDDTMRRVNLVGRSLAQYSSRPELDWQFAVLDSDTVNAFSAPGGFVFITRGLYEFAATDELLAGILGHEIAHITNKNALNLIRRGEALSGAKGFLLKRSSQARVADAQINQVAQAGSMLGFDVKGLTKTMFENGFSAQAEYAADKDGRNLAVTVGYAPGGLRAALAHLQQKGENRKTMFATHPPLNDRLKRLPEDAAGATLPVALAASIDAAEDQSGGEAK